MWQIKEISKILKDYALQHSYADFLDGPTASFVCSKLLSLFPESRILSMLFREGLGECLRNAPFNSALDSLDARSQARLFCKSYGMNESVTKYVEQMIELMGSVTIDDTNDVLIKILEEEKERVNIFTNERNMRTFINKREDFDMIIPNDVFDLHISSSYDGKQIPSLHRFSKIKKFHCYFPTSWKIINNINLQLLEDLYLINTDMDSDIEIKAPMLKKLGLSNHDEQESLTPLERLMRGTHKIIIRSENLSHLELSYFYGYDFSELETLTNIEYLTIKNCEVKDWQWLIPFKKLKGLYLYNTVTDISKIPSLDSLIELHLGHMNVNSIEQIISYPHLEILNLNGNQILKTSGIERFPCIRRLCLTRNPISKNGLDRKLDIPEVLVSDIDAEIDKIPRKYTDIFYWAYNSLMYEKKQMAEFPEWRRRSLEGKTEATRFAELVNSRFESNFFDLNPADTFGCYDTKMKIKFLSYAKEHYPFIVIKNTYERQIECELRGIVRDYQPKPGSILYVNHSVYRVQVSLIPERKGLNIICSNSDGFGIEKYVSEKRVEEACPFVNLSETQVKVELFDLYHTSEFKGLDVAIIAALHSLHKNISIPAACFITGEYSHKGNLIRDLLSERVLRLAKKHGASQICYFSARKEAPKNDYGIFVSLYHDFDSFK